MKCNLALFERVLWQLTALTVAFLFVAPLYWVLANSLRPVGLPPPRTLEWLPAPLAWSNYREIFRIVPLAHQIANSFFVSTIGASLTLVTASWAGLAMAQLPAGVRRWLVLFAVLLMMIPGTVVWLPRYVLFTSLGLVDTYFALFAPAIMGTRSLYVLMFYWTFRRVPLALYESARLDGANALTIWRRIALPMALPTALAVLLLAFSHFWSDFVDPLLFLKSEERYTLAVGLRMLQQMVITNWSLLLAAVVIMTTPVVLIYLALQQFIREDVTWRQLLKR
ncbi:MAG: carbohydrate ABC transporter permease [Caldilineaceae bacterium]|nr:carbohydrate ABC transporter permease [Caldilineaceae bacterium]